jgi:hypothetical protein
MDSHHLLFSGLPALPIPVIRGATIESLRSTFYGPSLLDEMAVQKDQSRPAHGVLSIAMTERGGASPIGAGSMKSLDLAKGSTGSYQGLNKRWGRG